MMNKNIEKIISSARESLIEEIKRKLKKSGYTVDVEVELPCTIDEDRYYTTIIQRLTLNENENVIVYSTCDIDDCDEDENEDPIELYSLDEIIKIIDAL